MRYQYVVILKKDSQRVTDALSVVLLLFSVIGFSLSGLHGLQTTHFTGAYGTGSTTGGPLAAWLALGAALLLLAGLAVNLVLRRRGATRIRYRYWLLAAALGWICFSSLYWIGAFFFLLAFLEYQTKRPLEIGFHSDRVVINSLIKRRFDWTAFNNVVLRDGLLTLDFKNNRLMQKEVADDDEEDDADEEEFNAFCRDRLASAG
jgi:hypothetical protein